MNLDRVWGCFPVLDQMQKVIPDLLCSQLIWRLAGKLREAPDGVEVSIDCEIGVVTKLQLLQHPFS